MNIRVLLVDGRKLLREGLTALLARHSDVHVVGEAADTAAGAKLAEALAADVAVLITSSGATSATAMIRELLSRRAETRIVLHSLYPTAAFVAEILAAGASGCVTKDCGSDELVRAIRTVANGQVYLSPAIADAVVRGFVVPTRQSGAARLSPREREVLRRIGDGESTRQIAVEFGVSCKTVETHRRRIMQKLGARSVAELTKHALREGLTSLESPQHSVN